MWKDDNDKIEKLWKRFLKKIDRYPCICPICEKMSAHVYLHRYKKNKGSVWIWCSECKNCTHGTIIVPEWWHDDNLIDLSKTTSHPDYLENKKKVIDIYVNKILDNYETF